MGRPPAERGGAAVPQSEDVGTGVRRDRPQAHRGTAMDHYAGINVSLEQSSACVVDATGRIVREAKVASEPAALITFLRGLNRPLARIGLEAGPLSPWLQTALVKVGFSIPMRASWPAW